MTDHKEIYKPFSFYKWHKKKLTRDGHTMLDDDVARDLNNYRRGFLTLKAAIKRHGGEETIESVWNAAIEHAISEVKACELVPSTGHRIRIYEAIGALCGLKSKIGVKL